MHTDKELIEAINALSMDGSSILAEDGKRLGHTGGRTEVPTIYRMESTDLLRLATNYEALLDAAKVVVEDKVNEDVRLLEQALWRIEGVTEETPCSYCGHPLKSHNRTYDCSEDPCVMVSRHHKPEDGRRCYVFAPAGWENGG